MLNKRTAVRFSKRLLDSDWTPPEVAVWLFSHHKLPRRRCAAIVAQAVRENNEELSSQMGNSHEN